MRAKKNLLITLFASCVYLLSAGFPVLADDIDIFTGGGGTTATATKNVLLVIDTSGSMAHAPQCTGNNCDTTSKNAIVREVLNELFTGQRVLNPSSPVEANPTFAGINFAVMRFKATSNSESYGAGHFTFPFTPLNNDNIGKFVTEVNNINAAGNTPLAGTLYEATRFYLALTPKYNDNMLTGLTTSVTDPTTNANTDYYTPDFTGQCGVENHVVILTDGKPVGDGDADPFIAQNSSDYTGTQSAPAGYTSDGTLPGYVSDLSIAQCSSSSKPDPDDNSKHYTKDDCLPLLSQYLYGHDFDGNPDNGTQNVITHTIAFDLNAQSGVANRLLDQTATDCDNYDPSQPAYDYVDNRNKPSRNCRAYSADNAMNLANAFKSILSQINNSTTTFTNAAVAIGSRLYHENEAYFALFKPDMKPRWQGNLKGYQILDTTDSGQVGKDFYDFASPTKAILDSSGNIKDTAVSKWGTAADGSDIDKGGAESHIPTTRTVYTYTGNYSGLSIDAPAVLDTVEIPSTLDKALFGAADDKERDNLVHWALGEEPDDLTANPITWHKRHVIGDPLHSQPVIVDYTDTDGTTTSYTFFGTNDGFLHAVNLTTGEEAFAFIPKELLPNLKTYLENPEMSQLQRPYGLDGQITVGRIKTGGTEHTILYFGMRRGGSNYYALDVSTISAPKLAWEITGGADGSTGFEELGQSWSKPLFAKVNFMDPDGKIVLIMGAGYDNKEDDPSNTDHTIGRAVYIVDATDGARLWWAHGSGANGSGVPGTRTQEELVIPQMGSSIPSSIAALDVNYDDIVDRLYLVDISGQLFRIDLNAEIDSTDSVGNHTVTTVPNGGVIASLRGTDPKDQRRFYNEPEIVFTKYGSTQFIRINVGSGYRAVPLGSTIQNRFYSIRDKYVYNVPAGYTSISEADLYNATTNHETDVINGDTKKGWYIDLAGSGEKALSQSMTINNHLMFTTYTPPQGAVNSCEPQSGSAKFYMVNLFDATPEKTYPLVRGGIPPSPMPLIFPGSNSSNPNLEIAVGMEFIKDTKKTDGNGNVLPPLGLEPVLNKNFWEEK
jgi:type IV pilus assembly protein PilY1